MSKSISNWLVTLYAVALLALGIIELFYDVIVLNDMVKVLMYVILFGVTALICRNAEKLDKRLEVIIYVILVGIGFLYTNMFILVSGIAVLYFAKSKVNYTSSIIVTICLVILFLASMLNGMVDKELVMVTPVREEYSPKNTYMVEQNYVNVNGIKGIRITIHREVAGIVDLSYWYDFTDEFNEVKWVDEDTFELGSETIDIKF